MQTFQELYYVALMLVILGLVIVIIGIALFMGPQLASYVRSANIPEPIRSILVVGTKVGSVEIYTSPILIAILAAIYIITMLRR